MTSNPDQTSALFSGNDFVSEYTCDLCELDNKYIEARGYCQDCEEYLCQDCYDTHLRPKPMRHHVLLDSKPLAASQQHKPDTDSCTEICPNHPNKVIEYYCSLHDVFGCAPCMTLNHRRCTNVDYIPDIANSTLSTYLHQAIGSRLAETTNNADKTIQTIEQKIANSDKTNSKALHDVAKLRRDLNSAVDTLENNIRKQVQKICSEDGERIANYKDKCQMISGEIHRIASKLRSLKHHNQFCQLFIEIKLAERKLAEMENTLQDIKTETEVKDCKLTLSTEIQTLLHNPESLAKLHVTQNHKAKSTLPQNDSPPTLPKQGPSKSLRQQDHQRQSMLMQIQDKGASNPQDHVLDKSLRSMKADIAVIKQTLGPSQPPTSSKAVLDMPQKTPVMSLEVEIPINSQTDKKASQITGSVVISGDKLIVVDRGNSTLKLIDLAQNLLVSQLDLQSEVWDITQMSSNQVAVTSTNKIFVVKLGRNFRLFNIGNKLSLDYTIKIFGHSKGIGCTGEKLLVSFSRPLKIELMDKTGVVLKTLAGMNEGVKRFTKPWYLEISRDKSTIYISDWINDTVTSLDMDGNVKAVFKDKELKAPVKLAAGKARVVYVCGSIFNQIHMLNSELTTGLTLQEMSDTPVSISHCEITDKLYVGTSSCTIKVFKLQ